MRLFHSCWNFDKDRWLGLGYAEPLYFDHNMYSIVKESNCKYLEVIEAIDRICTGNKERYELDNNAINMVAKIIGDKLREARLINDILLTQLMMKKGIFFSEYQFTDRKDTIRIGQEEKERLIKKIQEEQNQ